MVPGRVYRNNTISNLLIQSLHSYTVCITRRTIIMTLYSSSNKSIEDVDPLKQAGQLPSYSIQPDSTEYQQPQPQPQDRDVYSTAKPTAGERFHKISSKAGSPLNKAANLFGAEGWWPSTMDKECSKAARILHSFTSKSIQTS